jgi:transcriptional regulator with XRE-family HTH domain
MVSAYERDKRQPTLPTLLRLLEAAGFELRMHLEELDAHDRVLALIEEGRSPEERRVRDLQQQAWRDALPVVHEGQDRP